MSVREPASTRMTTQIPIIRPAASAQDIVEIRQLLREYEAWLGTDLCFQDFENELAGLPGGYAPPSGRLLIATAKNAAGNKTAGCVALRPFDQSVCEMKRLFVRADFRGTGLGRRLALAIIDEARAAGYRKMRLDTLPQQREAHQLYASLGFREIEPYRPNPIAGSLFLELDVSKPDVDAPSTSPRA
jgi:N-acetylglutamate synthase-like GNAT family acetyltransferase